MRRECIVFHTTITEKMPTLHLGLPKAASTALQREVFPSHPGGFFSADRDGRMLARNGFAWLWRQDRNLWRASRPLSLGAHFATCVRFSGEKRKAQLFLRKHPDSLVSSEGLVGNSLNPSLGAFGRAKGLRKLSENLKIIIVFRPHLDWAESAYYQLFTVEQRYQRTIGGLSLTDVYGDKDSIVPLDTLRWSAIARAYRTLFGRKNCLFLNFEDLDAGWTQAVETIESFLEVPRGSLREPSLRHREREANAAVFSDESRDRLAARTRFDWEQLQGYLSIPGATKR